MFRVSDDLTTFTATIYQVGYSERSGITYTEDFLQYVYDKFFMRWKFIYFPKNDAETLASGRALNHAIGIADSFEWDKNQIICKGRFIENERAEFLKAQFTSDNLKQFRIYPIATALVEEAYGSKFPNKKTFSLGFLDVGIDDP